MRLGGGQYGTIRVPAPARGARIGTLVPVRLSAAGCGRARVPGPSAHHMDCDSGNNDMVNGQWSSDLLEWRIGSTGREGLRQGLRVSGFKWFKWFSGEER